MSFFQPSPDGGSRFDQEMFDEQERELERVAEQHREETNGEPEQRGLGRLVARARATLRRRDSA